MTAPTIAPTLVRVHAESKPIRSVVIEVAAYVNQQLRSVSPRARRPQPQLAHVSDRTTAWGTGSLVSGAGHRDNGIGGDAFEIGFWVGSGNTPNKSDDPRLDPVPRRNDPKHPDDTKLGPAYEEVNQSFNKTPACPLCGRDTGLRRITSGIAEEIAIVCFNSECQWNCKTQNAPVPFLIIDRDIYRHAPAVLLGVIDKLALIGQHPATINRVMGSSASRAGANVPPATS